ncbi:hypothetical protein Tco_1099647 [Tanacetum coccineum]
MTGEPATEAPVNGGHNYNGPKRLDEIDMSVKMRTTCTWTERPYEASLFPGIGFGLFLRSLGRTGQGTVSGRQFLWGVGLPKGNGGVQRFPRAGRRLALECKGRRELDCKTHPSSRDESRPSNNVCCCVNKANKHILPKKPELNEDMYNWVIAKYEKPNTWIDSQFDRIADDVYTTFFEKAKPEIAQPETSEPETA